MQRDLSNGISELSLTEHENALLLQYKDLIRDQDKRLQDVQRDYQTLQKDKEDMQSRFKELQDANSQLQDQNTLLKAQISAGAHPVVESTSSVQITTSDNSALTAPLEERIKQLELANTEKEEELEKLRKDQEDLLELLTDQDVRLNTFKGRLRELGETFDDGDSDNNSLGSENES